MIKVFILVVIVLVSFSFTNSAKAYTFINATSTPCGVRLTWKPTFPKTTCLVTDSFWRWGEWIDYCVTQSVNKSKISVYRSTGGTSYDRYNNQLIFSGDVSSVPTSYSTHYDSSGNDDYYEYNYGGYNYSTGSGSYTDFRSSYTDLTAVPGNKYYYRIYEYDTNNYSDYSDGNIDFQRSDLRYYNTRGYNVDPIVWTDPNYPMLTQTDISYGENLVNYGNEFSNSCPFVQVPGDNLMGWYDFTLREPWGSKISDLTCSEKYAFKNSTTGWFEENPGSSDDKFDIIKMYGFSSDKFENVSKERQPMNYNWGWNWAYRGYKIYKTGSVGFNFYREVCTRGKDWLYTGDICTFEKVPTTDYTLTQPRTGYNLVEFNKNYVPPPETAEYYVDVHYRVTAVNQYGAESWPVEFSWTQPLPTCLNDCIDPNTIDPNEIFTIKNVLLSNDFLGTSKVLGWNNADNELGQYTYNASSTEQEWYIKPSNENKYAILVSKQDGKALSTDGYIDWSWTHFGESLYSLLSMTYEGPSFPGYIKGYENIYTYKGEYLPNPNWYDEQYGEFTIGYKIKKKDYNSSDDSQKWCIAPEKGPGEWNEEINDYNMVNTGNYAFINKNVQSPLKLLSLVNPDVPDPYYAEPYYSDPFRDTEGFLVWLNPDEGGYEKNGIIADYYPGSQGGSDLWQLDIPITELSCTGPQGETIQSGQNLTYYESNTTLQYYDPLDPSGADHCSDYAITASCNNGVLSSFKYSDG
ncbi:MAG: hypothetical protein M0P71_17930, partial [Melioribacteraceae bacterium]|nr:hypothetical protein [Melioribacteraceae bacterium]